MAYIVDTSVWVALFLDFDVEHQKARRILDRIRDTIYVPYCVISETATVLAYKHSKKQADNFLVYIENNRDLILINNEIAEELNFYKSLPHKISFADSALILLSRKLNAELITFDRQLLRIAKKIK